MALDELVLALEADAAARIEQLRGHAAGEAERVRRESEAEQSRQRAAALGGRERELRLAAAREIDAARRAGTRRVLETRAALLARVRDRVERRLTACAGDPGLPPLLERDLERAKGYFNAPPQVRTSTAGYTLRAPDGTLTVEATLPSRLAQAWPRIAIELVRRLEIDG